MGLAGATAEDAEGEFIKRICDTGIVTGESLDYHQHHHFYQSDYVPHYPVYGQKYEHHSLVL